MCREPVQGSPGRVPELGRSLALRPEAKPPLGLSFLLELYLSVAERIEAC